MPRYLCQGLFQFGARGWSEIYYVEKSSHVAASNTFDTLMDSRRNLLGLGCSIIATRVSDVDIPGDSLVREVALLPPSNNPVSDNPTNCWYTQIRSGNLYRRQLHLRGMPDDWLKMRDTGTGILDGTLNFQYGGFRATIVANNFLMRVVLKGGVADTGSDVTGLAVNADGLLTITAGVLGVGPGDRVKMKGWTGPDAKELNLTFRVKSVAGNVVTTGFKVPPGFDLNANAGGKAFPRVKGWVGITDASLMRPASKRTGRAFFVPAGRRLSRA